MAMRSASQQSHIYFLHPPRFRDFVLTAFSWRRLRLFHGIRRGFSLWNHAFGPMFSSLA